MRRGGLFFGVVVILLGLVLLAINLGMVSDVAWRLFWPAVIILLGLWFLVVPRFKTGEVKSEQVSFPLAGASEAEFTFKYGAGQLRISASSNPDELIGGSFTGGMESDMRMEGSKALVTLRTPSDSLFEGPWSSNQKGFEWNVGITKRIPLRINLPTGANESLIDLRDTLTNDIHLETGASRTEITLPAAAGMTKVSIDSGVAAVFLHVPQGVAASIQDESGLSGIKIDTHRFIQSGKHYESPDYATAINRVSIRISTGLGSVEID